VDNIDEVLKAALGPVARPRKAGKSKPRAA